MSNSFLHAQGIILRVYPYRDYDQIISLFTAEGIIKLIGYGSRSKRSKLFGLCTPLNHVEVNFKNTGNELLTCSEMHSISRNEDLRQNYTTLEASCDLLNAIYSSQVGEKAAPPLYALLLAYLQKMAFAPDPWVLALSFRLKLLKYEGVFNLPLHCHQCGIVLNEEAYFKGGEMFCRTDQTAGSIYINLEDLQLMTVLLESQSFQLLMSVHLPTVFKTKVLRLFDSCLLN